MTREDAEELALRMNEKDPPGVRYEAVGPDQETLDIGQQTVAPWYVRRVKLAPERG